MPKCLEGKLALGGLAVFALWLFVGLPILYGPQQAPQIQAKQQAEDCIENQRGCNPPSPCQESCPHSEHSGEDGTEFWPPFLGYRLKITDTLIAFFTAALFLATWFLWLATKKLIRSAEATAERQLRAYITIEHGGIILIDNESPAFITMLPVAKLRNVGQTPAKDLQTWTEGWVMLPGWLGAFAAAPHAEGRGDPKSIIGPQQDANVGEPFRISREEVTAIADRNLAIYLWGRADYRDVFGKTQWFIFKFQMTGPVQQYMIEGGHVQGWPLIPDASGHEASY